MLSFFSQASVWQSIGTCATLGVVGGTRSNCDADNDGQFDDRCAVGAKCKVQNTPNGGCGTGGLCNRVEQSLITLEYLNDVWTYDVHTMIWTRSRTTIAGHIYLFLSTRVGRFWAQSTRPTHRAFFTMVIIEELILVYGGLGPFCYEFCKDVWALNTTSNQWYSDIYKRGGQGSGTGDQVLDAKLTGRPIKRPLTWSYGGADDPQWKLHAFNDGYRYEDDPDAQYRIPDRRFHHVAVAWRQPAHKAPFYYEAPRAQPCVNHSKPFYNASFSLTVPYTNYTLYQCNETKSKLIDMPSIRWMVIYGGFGGAKKTKDITVQKSTYYLEDTWKYNIDTQIWYPMKPFFRNGVKPGKRRGHSAVLYRDTMYMFAGRRDFQPEQFALVINEANKLVTNDVWGYNIPNNTWFFVPPAKNTTTPHERHGQRAVIWDDIMIMVGGYYDPQEYYNDTWHYNITSRVWLQKQIFGKYPTKRFQFGLALWNHVGVIFGGYGADCDIVETGSPGIYCQPNGPAYYLGDTWHYSLKTCPNGCTRNGTCHYGSCICGPTFDGYDCSNFTCPDCTTMIADPELNMPCEVWDYNYNPVVFQNNPDPINPVTEAIHRWGAGLPVMLSNSSILDGNCYYDYGRQSKVCRSCSLQGTCHPPTGTCVCEPMYSNFDCSYMACPHITCNGGGQCLLNGKCVCEYAFFEHDCRINFACPNDCSYQVCAKYRPHTAFNDSLITLIVKGICEPEGQCRCYEGFYGSDCSIAIAYSSTSRISITLMPILYAFAMIYLLSHFQ